jgi:ABC-2 type transport system permease protein
VIRLFRSELLRARSRRVVAMLFVAGVILIVVAMVIAAANSHKPSPEDVTRAEAFSQKQFARCMQGKLFGRPGEVPPGFASLEEFCHAVSAPEPTANMRLSDLALVTEHTGTFTILLGVAIAASLGGADWTAGTMTTLLTWEARRIRVLLVRALVVVIVVAVVTIVLQALLIGTFSLGVALRGTGLGTPPGEVRHAFEAAFRISAVAAAFALVALAVATVGRSTVAALGVLFGYLVLFEGVIAGFRPSIQDRLLVRAGGVIVGQQPIYDTRGEASVVFGPLQHPPELLGIHEAWVVLGVYIVVLLGIALLVLRARDVN